MILSFNTQPPEGGWEYEIHGTGMPNGLGFNTQPPEGGWKSDLWRSCRPRSFNTQPPEGGWIRYAKKVKRIQKFQHTAA